MTFEEIKKNKEVNAFIRRGIIILDYWDIHCSIVANTAAMILEKFGYSEHDIELAKIAGYMHDIGNVINRSHHAEYGGLLANEILKESGMSIEDRITIVSAISNHDESTGGVVDPVSAALIIADKTDESLEMLRAE